MVSQGSLLPRRCVCQAVELLDFAIQNGSHTLDFSSPFFLSSTFTDSPFWEKFPMIVICFFREPCPEQKGRANMSLHVTGRGFSPLLFVVTSFPVHTNDWHSAWQGSICMLEAYGSYRGISLSHRWAHGAVPWYYLYWWGISGSGVEFPAYLDSCDWQLTAPCCWNCSWSVLCKHFFPVFVKEKKVKTTI